MAEKRGRTFWDFLAEQDDPLTLVYVTLALGGGALTGVIAIIFGR